MAFDTKPNLNNQKFEQFSGDSLNLSGNTYVYGDIQYAGSGPTTPTSKSLADRAFVTGITSTLIFPVTGSSNGISIQNKNAILGGTLTGNTVLQLTGHSFIQNNTKNNAYLFLNYFSATQGINTGDNFPSNPAAYIQEDSLHNIWVAVSNASLWRYNRSTHVGTLFSSSVGPQSGPNLPTGSGLYQICVNHKYVFVPVYGGGLWVYNVTANTSQLYTTSGGGNTGSNLPDNNIYAASASATHVFVATETGGIWRLNLSTLVADIFNSSGGANTGTNLPVDDCYWTEIANNNLFVGTSAGLWRLNLGTLVGSLYSTTISGQTSGPNLVDDNPYPLIAANNHIFVGSPNGLGLWTLDTTTNISRLFTTSSGSQIGVNLLDNTVSGFGFDSNTNNLYVYGNSISTLGAWVYNVGTNNSRIFYPTQDILGFNNNGSFNIAPPVNFYFSTGSTSFWSAIDSAIMEGNTASSLSEGISFGNDGFIYTTGTSYNYLRDKELMPIDFGRAKLFTFSNGLTKTTTTPRKLNEPDVITLGGNVNSVLLTVTGSSFVIRRASNNNALSVTSSASNLGYGPSLPTTNRNELNITSNSINLKIGASATTTTITDGRSTKKGIEYAGITSYSAFTNNSLVTKGYVTGLTSSSGVQTANNGLTKSGQNVHLGGSLTGATTIGLGSNSITFTGTTGTLKYGSDLSANYTPRSLVDKGYVTGLTSSITASNGLTKLGNNIKLGGNVTGSTTLTLTGSSSALNLLSDEIVYYSNDGIMNSYTNNPLTAGQNYPTNFQPNFAFEDSSSQLWFTLAGSTGGLLAFIQDFIQFNTNDPDTNMNATVFNNTSGNYSGTLIPSQPIRGAVMVNDKIYYVYLVTGGGGLYEFDTVSLTNTVYNNTSGNYSGDLIPTGQSVTITTDGVNKIAVNFATQNGGVYIYNISANTVTKYTNTSGNYTGTLLGTNATSNAIVNNVLYVGRPASTAQIWALNLSSLVATAFTNTSGNYSGDLIPTTLTEIIGIGNDIWYRSTSGIYRFTTTTHVNTKFDTSKTTYSGDALLSTSFSSFKYVGGNLWIRYSTNATSVFNPTSLVNRTIPTILKITDGYWNVSQNTPLYLTPSNKLLFATSNGFMNLVSIVSPFTYTIDEYGLRTTSDVSSYFLGKGNYLIDKNYIDNYLNISQGVSSSINANTKKLDVILGSTSPIKDNSTISIYLGNNSNFMVIGGDGISYPSAPGLNIGGNVTGVTNTASLFGGIVSLSTVTNTGNTASIGINQNIMTIEGTGSFKGAQYNADYSTNYTNRSLVDKAYVTGLTSPSSKSSFSIVGSTGGTTTFTLTHNKNTRDVIVQVYQNFSPYGTVIVDVQRTTVNAVDVVFGVAPITGENYRVVVI